MIRATGPGAPKVLMVLTPEPAALSRSKESRASGPDPKALVMGTAPFVTMTGCAQYLPSR